MNPFKTLATALAAFMVAFRDKMNPILASLQPLEQQEVSDPIKHVLRAAKWAMDDANQLAESFDGKVAEVERMLGEYTNKVGEEALAAAVAAKTHIPAADHDAAITAAKDEVKTTLEKDFDAKLAAAKTTFERKADAIAKVGPAAITALKDEDFIAEDFAARLGVVEDRLKVLTEAGLTAESKPKVFAALIAHGVDEAGKAAFDAQLEVLKEASGGEFKASADPKAPVPPKQAPAPGSQPAAKKSAVI